MAELIALHFHTPQLANMLEFYTQQMGMQASHLPESGAGQVSLLVGPHRVLILEQAQEKRLANAYYAVRSKPHWAKGQELLKRLGAKPFESRLFDGQGLQLADPEGNLMSFGQPSTLALKLLDSKKPGNSDNGLVIEGRLQHYGLGTKKPEVMQDFYVNHLGFALSDEVFADDGALRSSFVRATHEHHSVAIFGNGNPGFDHVSFEVNTWNAIKDWADHLASFETKIFWGPGRHGSGNNLFIFFHDPDKNMLEISSELQVINPGAPAGRWGFDYKAYNLWGQAAVRV